MTAAYLAPDLKFKAWDNNGNPLVGGKLFTYAAGTTTPIATYTDALQSGTNTNPVILNARGEANVYLLPNVGYKFLLQDSLGNTIPGWPVDNIVNAQLTTLYGGVDTGSANAYVLNFVAPYAALTDGVLIYWVPAHTNTGASTLNVNGLGVVTILNPDASALTDGEIVANGMVGVVYRGGNFYLVASAQSLPQTGTFAITATGFTTTVNGTASYSISSNYVSLFVPYLNGTSNNVGFTLTGLPAAIQPPSRFALVVPVAEDGGSSTGAVASFDPLNPGVITLTKGLGSTAGGNWTNSGIKGIGQLIGGLFQYGVTLFYNLI